MIRELCRHRWRTPLCKRALCSHKVIATTHQPYPTLQRELFVRSGAGLAHQRAQTGAEGSLKALDVGGIDQLSYRTLWVPITSASVPATTRQRTSTTRLRR